MTKEPPPLERFRWLRNGGQWGTPGWSMHPVCVERIAAFAQSYAGRRILEVGTSRGYLAAIMTAYGGLVTTVDQVDRGAVHNLREMGAKVVLSDGAAFLQRAVDKFALVVVDLNDNGQKVWRTLWRSCPNRTRWHINFVQHASFDCVSIRWSTGKLQTALGELAQKCHPKRLHLR